jgi:Dolichyl-phosphate-mannose-protein mannosyltransferase
MATAETAEDARRGHPGRRWIWAGLALVLGGGLALRLWGVRQGLPYAYNTDEADHFVPHAVEMFAHGTLNPHYFANPPAFTYVLHLLFGIYYGGAHAVIRAYALDPGELYTLARIAAAVLGALALWLLYLVGARLFGRAAGLLAAAIEAVAFLPVFYAHLALNDAPTLAPLTLSLLGTAGVLRKGRLRDHLLAGTGLGLACATKYTAGIAIVPYAAAAASCYLGGPPGAGRRALAGLAGFGACALGAFLALNPYALLDYSSFHAQLAHQSAQSAESQGKLGASRQGGLVYYLWSLTWGLGWVPALAALAGAVTVWWRERGLGWLLVPAPLLFLAFMGIQGRYFGRWVMPILPILCLLAAGWALQAITLARGAARAAGDAGAAGEAGAAAAESAAARPGWPGGPARTVLAALLVAALLAQGLIYSVHSGLLLSRTDTRTLTRNWMVANIPPGARVVVEPVSPNSWAREAPGKTGGCRGSTVNYRWCKWPSLVSYVTPSGAVDPAGRHKVGIEDYVRTLAPSLIPFYESLGFCWVVSASTEAGRAYADPRAVPLALAYYRALASQGEVVHRASPYSAGQGPVAFGFDWSFDYYPLAYRRPGPSITVYRLRGGRCGA